MTIRMHPPAAGGTIVCYGRTYVGVAGTTIDMPDGDAFVAGSNGWTLASRGGVGTTAQRPSVPNKGDSYIDTTVGSIIMFDGKVWRNHATGATV